MTYYVYVLKNTSKSKLTTYVGYAKNLKKRLKLHNKGLGAKFTRGRNWEIMYYEKYPTKGEAISREYYIKKNRKIRDKIKDKFK